MVEIDWNFYIISLIGALIIGVIGGLILDWIRIYLKIKWRETSGDKREINEVLRRIRKGGRIYQYEKDWLKRGSSDNHFIATFIGDLIREQDFIDIQNSINIISKYRWFSNIKKFWEVREKILDLNGKINEIYESKPIFILNEQSISLNSKDILINEFIKNVNECLKLYFEIIVIEYR